MHLPPWGEHVASGGKLGAEEVMFLATPAQNRKPEVGNAIRLQRRLQRQQVKKQDVAQTPQTLTLLTKVYQIFLSGLFSISCMSFE